MLLQAPSDLSKNSMALMYHSPLSSVLRPRQHSIGYMADDFYRSKDPTNSIKVLKEAIKENTENANNKIHTYTYTIIHIKRIQI